MINNLPKQPTIPPMPQRRIDQMGMIPIKLERREPIMRWIPCSERLPEIEDHHVSKLCLVCCKAEVEGGYVYGFAELEENIFGQVGWNCERDDEYHEPIGEVIAWMPMPEVYGGETDG